MAAKKAPVQKAYTVFPNISDIFVHLDGLSEVVCKIRAQQDPGDSTKSLLFTLGNDEAGGITIEVYHHEDAIEKLNEVFDRGYITWEQYQSLFDGITRLNLPRDPVVLQLEASIKRTSSIAGALKLSLDRLGLKRTADAINNVVKKAA